MGSFTKLKKYTNDPETLSEEAKKYREELIKEAIDNHGAIEGTVKIERRLIKSEKG